MNPNFGKRKGGDAVEREHLQREREVQSGEDQNCETVAQIVRITPNACGHQLAKDDLFEQRSSAGTKDQQELRVPVQLKMRALFLINEVERPQEHHVRDHRRARRPKAGGSAKEQCRAVRREQVQRQRREGRQAQRREQHRAGGQRHVRNLNGVQDNQDQSHETQKHAGNQRPRPVTRAQRPVQLSVDRGASFWRQRPVITLEGLVGRGYELWIQVGGNSLPAGFSQQSPEQAGLRALSGRRGFCAIVHWNALPEKGGLELWFIMSAAESKLPNVAIVGSTGAVGVELLRVLEERNFPLASLRLLSSARSAGKKQTFRGEEYTVEELKEDSFAGVDIALFSAGGSISKRFGPIAVKAGAVVVDNSSAFRMDPNTPLIVPEINPEDMREHKGIIANPNCSTIIMLMAIFPIHRVNPVKSIVVSTYQASSGAGAAAMQELEDQARDYVAGKELKPEIFPYPIAFNAFSHNSDMDLDSGYNTEETKMIQETHKILKADQISVAPTCIRIGTFRAHAESVHLELTNPADLAEVRAELEKMPGVKLVDDREKNYFPMPMESTGVDDVLVGRIRHSAGSADGRQVDLFCCGDQILKGAALNAVQIAELL